MDTSAPAQFAEDYILVTENESDAYHEIMEMPEFKSGNVADLSDRLRDEFEEYIGQVVERERENGNETGALLISQMLIGWGTHSFDIIARHYLQIHAGQEVNA